MEKEVRKCWTCGKDMPEGSMDHFCSHKCSLKAIERMNWIKRTHIKAQIYEKLYYMEMERETWTLQ